MSTRLQRALVAAGVSGPGVVRVLEAHDAAGAHRAGLLPPDEEDPRWLHPGRVVVILLADTQLRDSGLLALASGLDQGRPRLMPPGIRGLAVAAGLVLPGGSPGARAGGKDGATLEEMAETEGLGAETGEEAEAEWLEALVALEPALLTLALADALDHLRHLHLSPPTPVRARTVRRAEEALLPLAARHGGVLERRFRWWCSRVGRGLAASRHFDSC